MRRFAVSVLLSLIFLSATAQTPVRITVDVKDAGTPTLTYFNLDEITADGPRAAVSAARSGKTIFYLPDDKNIYIFFLDFTGTRHDHQILRGVLLPGERIEVLGESKGNYLEYDITGSPLMEAYAEHRKTFAHIDKQLTENLDHKNTPNVFKEDLLSQYRNLINGYEAEYIRENPDSPLSAWYFVSVANPLTYSSIYERLGDGLKTGYYARLMGPSLDFFRAAAAAEKIDVGSAAPLFSTRDVNGERTGFSGRNDKVTVLYFWGSWSEEHIGEFPRISELLSLYGDRMNFIGINAYDDPRRIRKIAGSYELPWSMVWDEDKAISTMYGVFTYPTEIIISPNGVIRGIFYGDYENFVRTLTRLLDR